MHLKKGLGKQRAIDRMPGYDNVAFTIRSDIAVLAEDFPMATPIRAETD
jgi:hypothetical protein